MLPLIRSEFIKLATVRTNLLFLFATAAITALVVAMQAASAGGEFMGPLTEPATQQALFASGAEPVTLIAIVFGCLALSTEFRHHTIVATLLSHPNRGRVVAAKAVGAIISGALLAMVAIAVGTIGTVVILRFADAGVVLETVDLLRGFAGTIGAAALGSLLGMGIGGIVRNQALAVGATLLLLLAVEPLVASLAPSIGRWMPLSLGSAIASGRTVDDLSLTAALLVLAAYGIAAATMATIGLRRVDIT